MSRIIGLPPLPVEEETDYYFGVDEISPDGFTGRISLQQIYAGADLNIVRVKIISGNDGIVVDIADPEFPSVSLGASVLASLGLADSAVQPTRSINVTSALSGGGSLASDLTIGLSSTTIASLVLADSAIQADDLGALAYKEQVTVDEIDTVGVPSGATVLFGDGTWRELEGGGNMLSSVYDPQSIGADAFDRENHTGTQSVATITGLGTMATRTAGTAGTSFRNNGANNERFALLSRSIAAGDGLSGGGDLSANRTFAVDSTVARTATQVVAGNGLSGGGTLAADRTLAVGAGDGISVAAATVGVDSTVARTATQIVAGNGLSGGGTLAANRTLNVVGGDGINATAANVAVDATVVRTAGNQSIAGNKNFTGNLQSSGRPVAEVYTGGVQNYVDFPIGTQLLCVQLGVAPPNRNATGVVRLGGGNAQFTVGGTAGTLVNGTWRSRGQTDGLSHVLMERTA